MKTSPRLLTLIFALILVIGVAQSATWAIAQDDPAADWKQQAEDALALEILPDYDPDHPPAPDIAPIYRTRVIANNYFALYELDPTAYKWAGLAALVSCNIFVSLEASIGQTAPPPFNTLPSLLTEGNLAVYTDLYWQHLAFAEGGLDELERLFALGALDESSIAAWRMIADGLEQDDPDAVWAGNTELLRREQEVVLQPIVYDGQAALWAILETLPAAMMSPVPGDTAIFDADGGDFVTFADRWVWIAEHIFPAWREFEASPNAVNTVRKAFNPCWIPPDDDPRRES